jgi:predicted PurR-regulated permease PerM
MVEYIRTPWRRPSRTAWIALLLALVLSLLVVLRILAVFVSVIFMALVAAGLLYQPFRKLAALLNGRRQIAAGLICLALVVGLMLPMAWIAVEVSRETIAFYRLSTDQLNEHTLLDAIRSYQAELDRFNRLLAPFGRSVTAEELVDRISAAAAGVGRFFYRQGVSIAAGLVRFVIGFLIWVLTLYFLLVEGRALRHWFRGVIPLAADEQDFVRTRFMDMAGSLVIGNGIAGVLQGVGGGLVFFLLDLQGPVLWGVVMAILGWIPVIGISAVYIPAWAILMLAGDPGRAFTLLIPLMILATVVESVLKPVLVGRRTQLPTLLVFFALLGGFDAFGPVGLVVGPLMVTVFLALVEIYRDRYQPFLLPSTPTGEEPPDVTTEEGGREVPPGADTPDRTASTPAANPG